MELFLNLLWFALAVATVLVWRIYWTRQQRDAHYDSLQQWTALACALLFLFFAVSMTDDLHSETLLFDDVGRRHSAVLTCADHSFRSGTVVRQAGAAILPSRGTLEPLGPFQGVAPLLEVSIPVFGKSHSPDRSPPASAL
jgi:hypothetical protein